MVPTYYSHVFRLGAMARAAVERHNAVWSERWRRFLGATPPPRWRRGIPVNAEWRALYESFLPVAEYVASLRRVARCVLPHPSWIPNALGLDSAHLAARARFASLPDLWLQLPPGLAEGVLLETERLPALLCALADPAQFGTADGRYPGQSATLREWLAERPVGPVALLDVGSGTGEGTREAMAVLCAAGRSVRAVAVTREPLEAWMGSTGCRPHRDADAAAGGVGFVVGDAGALPVGGEFAVILCNGLVGGRFVQTERAFTSVLGEFGRLLAPGGLVLVGCRFHAGREPYLAWFREVAEARGWRVGGTLLEMVLRRG